MQLKHFLKFINFKKIKLELKVGGDNAAKTAIDYGITCSAVYPVLSLLETVADVKYKKINISADFENKKSTFDFSLEIKTLLLFILIFAVKILNEYRKFSIRNDL